MKGAPPPVDILKQPLDTLVIYTLAWATFFILLRLQFRRHMIPNAHYWGSARSTLPGGAMRVIPWYTVVFPILLWVMSLLLLVLRTSLRDGMPAVYCERLWLGCMVSSVLSFVPFTRLGLLD